MDLPNNLIYVQYNSKLNSNYNNYFYDFNNLSFLDNPFKYIQYNTAIF